jgi:predicted flap endonuclease-1-like 5' DNA nuclease
MPKFTKEADELETRFEKWMYVLKNLKRLDDIPDRLRESVFERIFAAAEIAKLTSEEYRAYIDSLNSYRDLKNSLDYVEAKRTKEIAKELKNLGIPFDQISAATKLTIEEIEKI